MDDKLLERAVTEDTTEMLKPVLQLAYTLKAPSELEVMQVAHETNKKLGYELFDDLKYSQLILDFARVSRAVQVNAIQGSK